MSTSIYYQTEEAWKSMLEDIEQAEQSIYLHQFMFDSESTEIGKQLMDRLRAAKERGVTIHTIIDAAGSWKLFQQKLLKSEDFLSFYVRRRRLPFHIWKTFNRDHRKLLVIDEKITHIGGVIFLESARHWNDLNLRFVREDIASEAILRFNRTYNRLFNESKYKLKATQKKFFTEQSRMFLGRYHYKKLKSQIKSAKNAITIVTPYLSPPHSIQRHLENALDRGVTITIIMPAKTDLLFAQLVNEYYAKKLAKRGMNIMTLEKMNHAKVQQIDGWTSVGSVNLDRLSLRFNYEMNISVPSNDIPLVDEVVEEWKKQANTLEPEQIDHGPFKRLLVQLLKWFI